MRVTDADVLLTLPTFADSDGVDVDALINDAINWYADGGRTHDADGVHGVHDATDDDAQDDAQDAQDAQDARRTRRTRRYADGEHCEHVRRYRRVVGARRASDKRRADADAERVAREHAERAERVARERAQRLAFPCYFDDCTCGRCDLVSVASVREHNERVAMRKHNDRIVYEYVARKFHDDALRARRVDSDRLSERIADMAILTGNDPVQAIARERTHISRSLHRAQRADRRAKLHRARRHYAMTKGSAFSARVVAEHRLRRETMTVRERASVGVVQQNDAIAVAYQDWYDANIRNVRRDDAPTPTPTPKVTYERRLTALERGYGVIDADGQRRDAMNDAYTMAERLEQRSQISAFVRWHYDAIKSVASYRAAFRPA